MTADPRLRRKTIALVGLMGAGKSSIGRRLSVVLDLPFRDADSEVEAAAGRTISEIFESFGEGLVALHGTVLTTNQTFFSFAAANADGYNHFKFLGANKVGFEDLFGGGDKDHNDLIVELTFG